MGGNGNSEEKFSLRGAANEGARIAAASKGTGLPGKGKNQSQGLKPGNTPAHAGLKRGDSSSSKGKSRDQKKVAKMEKAAQAADAYGAVSPDGKAYAAGIRGAAYVYKHRKAIRKRALITWIAISLVPLLLLATMAFTIVSFMGSLSQQAQAASNVASPDFGANVVVDEASLQQVVALMNQGHGAGEQVDPNFVRIEVIQAARMPTFVPGCYFRWSILQAIADHESGGMRGRTVLTSGEYSPWVNSGTPSSSVDTDQGKWDLDPNADHAMGPYQFIMPSWFGYRGNDGQLHGGFHSDGGGGGVDGTAPDGIESPHNVFDEAIGVGKHLCPAARDNDPKTIDDYHDPANPNWSELDPVMWQYAGGKDNVPQADSFVAYMHDRVTKYDGAEYQIKFTVSQATLVGFGTAGAPTHQAEIAVNFALAQQGIPYSQSGRFGPYHFDCSGLAWAAYNAAGMNLATVSSTQFLQGPQIPMDQLLPGDLVYFYPNESPAPGHVGIYIGGGNFVHAPHTGDVVRIAPLAGYYTANFAGATRPSANPALLPNPTPPTGQATTA